MICPNCKEIIEYNNSYCSNCGKRIKIKKEDYIENYIGKKYQEVKQNDFSTYAALLGPFYLISKKMIMKGIILISIILLIGYYNINLALLISIIIHIILGFQFNKMYLKDAQEKTEEIIMNNTNKSNTELLEICKKSGKTSPSLALMPLLLLLFLSFFSKNNVNNLETNIVRNLQTSNNQLNYYIPKEFNPGKYNNNNYYHVSYYDNSNNCSITIITTNNTDIYNKIYLQNDENTTKKQEMIHNHLWNKQISFNDNITVDLTTTYQNKLYHIKYKYVGEKCKALTQQFVTSLIFSK